MNFYGFLWHNNVKIQYLIILERFDHFLIFFEQKINKQWINYNHYLFYSLIDCWFHFIHIFDVFICIKKYKISKFFFRIKRIKHFSALQKWNLKIFMTVRSNSFDDDVMTWMDVEHKENDVVSKMEFLPWKPQSKVKAWVWQTLRMSIQTEIAWSVRLQVAASLTKDWT